MKHGGGNIMVWGSFGGGKVGQLIEVKGILNKEGYHSILQRHLIPSGLENIGRGFILQQDNDPKHTSKLCTNYIKKKECAEILKIMEWPPNSPDVSPIELLWEELDRKIRDECITNKDSLFSHLCEHWQHISEELLDKLIARMPRICQAIIVAKGGHFDEKKV